MSIYIYKHKHIYVHIHTPTYIHIHIQYMIVENNNVRYMKLKELKTIFKAQKYPNMVVEKGIEKALAIPQEQLRNEKLKKKDYILPFISIYNPNNPNVFPKVREYIEYIETSKP